MKRSTAIATIMLIMGFLLRLFIALHGIHGTDILAHIAGAMSFLETGSPYCKAVFTYPPLYSVLQGLSIAILGRNVIGFKFIAMAFDTLLALAIFIIVRKIIEDRYALATLIMWLFNPLALLVSSWYGLFDSVPMFFALISLYLLAFVERYALSSMFLALGAVTKFFPGLLVPVALTHLYLHKRKIAIIVKYIVLFIAIFTIIDVILSYKCLSRAIEQQLLFHLERPDQGLSLVPPTHITKVLCLATSAVVGIVSYLYLGKGLSKGLRVLISSTLCLATLSLLNPFIYPHYITWYLPLMIATLVTMLRRKGIGVSIIAILAYTVIGSLYWKFYRDIHVVMYLKLSYYIVTLALIGVIVAIARRKPAYAIAFSRQRSYGATTG